LNPRIIFPSSWIIALSHSPIYSLIIISLLHIFFSIDGSDHGGAWYHGWLYGESGYVRKSAVAVMRSASNNSASDSSFPPPTQAQVPTTISEVCKDNLFCFSLFFVFV
jgi:hypothetical protein